MPDAVCDHGITVGRARARVFCAISASLWAFEFSLLLSQAAVFEQTAGRSICPNS
jgi:hypothetical protein